MRLLVVFFALLLISGCGELECNPQGRYLVVQPYAGVSNRLRVLNSAAIMAKLTGRELVVEWRLIEKETPVRWDQLFKNPMTMFDQSSLASAGCSLDMIKSAKPGNPIIKNLGNKNNSKKGDQLRLGQITDDREPIIYFGTSLNFQPDESYISKADYQRDYRLFYKNLDPPGLVIREVEEFKQKHFVDNFVIGVSLRIWSTGTPDAYAKQDPELFQKFIKAMKEALEDHPSAIFFLAGDNREKKEELLNMPEFNEKIITRDIEIKRSTVDDQLSALVDWFLLGSTEYIIGTRDSSFSDEAAFMTKERRKVNVGNPALP